MASSRVHGRLVGHPSNCKHATMLKLIRLIWQTAIGRQLISFSSTQPFLWRNWILNRIIIIFAYLIALRGRHRLLPILWIHAIVIGWHLSYYQLRAIANITTWQWGRWYSGRNSRLFEVWRWLNVELKFATLLSSREVGEKAFSCTAATTCWQGVVVLLAAQTWDGGERDVGGRRGACEWRDPRNGRLDTWRIWKIKRYSLCKCAEANQHVDQFT